MPAIMEMLSSGRITPPSLMMRLVNGVSKHLRLVAPDEAGAGAEQEAQADGEDDDGELRLADDAPQHQRVEQIAEHGHAQGGEQEAQPVVHPHGADEGQRHEGAQHHQVALGEIHHLGGFVDQHEAERDQAVDAALRSAADDQLSELHLAVPHIRVSPLLASARPATL